MSEKPTYEELVIKVLDLENKLRTGISEELEKKDELINSFMNSTSDGFILFNTNMDILNMNKIAISILEIESSVIGMNASDLFPGFADLLGKAEIKKPIGTNKPICIKNVNPHPKLKEHHYSVKIFKTGVDTGMFISDITDYRANSIRTEKLNELTERLMKQASLDEKLKTITDASVDIFNADFSRIWIIKKGDLCIKGCIHTEADEDRFKCKNRNLCLHLMASSGRYTQLDGNHGRVPFGCYKIGQVASGIEPKFLTNDVQNDPRIHDHEWARRLGLSSFAGYRLLLSDDQVIGVFALFSKKNISSDDDIQLKYIAGLISQVIQTSTAKTALTNNEKNSRALLNATTESAFLIETDGTIVTYNNVTATRLGKEPRELVGRNIFDLIPPELVKSRKKRVDQVIKTGIPVRFEDKRAEFVIDQNIYPVTDSQGKVKRIAIYARDITKERHIEKSLEESEEKFRSILEAMNDPLYICSSDHKIEYMNSAMIKRVGHDATGETCYRVMHNLDKKCPWCVFKTVKQKHHIAYEVTSPKDNKIYHITNSPLSYGKEIISKISIYRDVTNTKKIERELLQARKLESIGILSGGIAHDFNNLLFMIVGNIELAKNELKQEPEIDDFLNEALNASMKAQKLTNQLVTFAKGGFPEKKQGSIEEALREVASACLSNSTLKYRLQISQDLPIVKFDKDQICYAFRNILINAVEFSNKDSAFTIKVKKTILGKENNLHFPDGSYIQISFSDQGVGIPEENLVRIFDPYFSTKEEGSKKGKGLGLATTYAIISKHQGHITVESELGAGSTFIVYLPAHINEV